MDDDTKDMRSFVDSIKRPPPNKPRGTCSYVEEFVDPKYGTISTIS